MSCIRGISAVSVVQGFNLNFAKCIELQTDMKVAPHSLWKPYHLLQTIFFFNNKRNLSKTFDSEKNSLLKIGHQKKQKFTAIHIFLIFSFIEIASSERNTFSRIRRTRRIGRTRAVLGTWPGESLTSSSLARPSEQTSTTTRFEKKYFLFLSKWVDHSYQLIVHPRYTWSTWTWRWTGFYLCSALSSSTASSTADSGKARGALE